MMLTVLAYTGGVLGVATAIGGIVWGTVALVNSSRDKAQAFAENQVKTCQANHEQGNTALLEQISKIVDNHESDSRLIFSRLNDIDLWRKEINGQLKLYGERTGFLNQILEEQKTHIGTLAGSQQQMALTLATLTQTLKDNQKS